MKRISNKFFVLLVFIALCSLGTSALALTEEELALQRMQDRINTMEKSMSTMQQELYRSSGKSKSKQPVSDEPIGASDERERALNGKIEELEHSISTLAAKLDKIIADIDFRIAALEKKVSAAPVPNAEASPAVAAPQDDDNKPVDISPDKKEGTENIDGIDTGKPAAAAPATVETLVAAHNPETASEKPAAAAAKPESPVKIAYDKAYEFIRLSKYADAEKSFKDFIAANKGHELVGNAYFWLGESYFSRQNYQSSAVNFLKGYQDFPKGNKAAESLFKLGLSLKEMKKEKEACATFAKMKKEYPSSDKALLGKMESERKALKCK